jgi:hypothetical protein
MESAHLPEKAAGREINAYREGFVPVRLKSYQEALRFGKELIDTGLLPPSIKRPAQAVAIILTGQEMGIPPMRALRTIYIVEGRPTMKAEEMLAHFRAHGGKAKEVKATDVECAWEFTHPNGDVHVERLTFEDCKPFATTREGKLKDNWGKNPGKRIMLRWRTIANGLRVAAPDLFGAIYTPEEMGEVESIPEDRTADTVADLRERLDDAKAEPAVEVEAEEVPEIENCVECGVELNMDNVADDGLCLDCAMKDEKPKARRSRKEDPDWTPR